jgi:hypothetical protein
MYNKIVTTLVLIFALAGTAHAQYYSTSYGFGHDAFINSNLITPDSFANVAYQEHFRGPSFAPVPVSPSYFNFAYAAAPRFAPTFAEPQRTPSSLNFAFTPSYFAPTYGNGPSFGDIGINLPSHITPTYGPGLDFGSLNFNLPQHQIPNFGNSLVFNPVSLNYYQPVFPIYQTPSRVLFNTEVFYQSFVGPFN